MEKEKLKTNETTKEALERMKEIKHNLTINREFFNIGEYEYYKQRAKEISEEFKFNGGCGIFYWNKNVRKDKKIRCQTNHPCPSCQAKKEIKKIWKDLNNDK